MILEILIIAVPALILGVAIGWILWKKFKLLDKTVEKIKDNNKQKTINNPKILIEKLNKNGPIVDMGEELSFGIAKNDQGKEVLDISRKPHVSLYVEKEKKPKEEKKNLRKSKKKKIKKEVKVVPIAPVKITMPIEEKEQIDEEDEEIKKILEDMEEEDETPEEDEEESKEEEKEDEKS